MSTFKWENESVESQLAHDRQQDQIRENKRQFEVNKDATIAAASEYNLEGTLLSEIVHKMVSENNARSLWYKGQINYDMSVYDAVVEACIQLGLSTEDYSPYLNDKGDQIEIWI